MVAEKTVAARLRLAIRAMFVRLKRQAVFSRWNRPADAGPGGPGEPQQPRPRAGGTPPTRSALEVEQSSALTRDCPASTSCSSAPSVRKVRARAGELGTCVRVQLSLADDDPRRGYRVRLLMPGVDDADGDGEGTVGECAAWRCASLGCAGRRVEARRPRDRADATRGC